MIDLEWRRNILMSDGCWKNPQSDSGLVTYTMEHTHLEDEHLDLGQGDRFDYAQPMRWVETKA